MDAALLREREAFKRKAMAIPTVEKRKINKTASSSSASASSASARDSSARAKLDLAQMKSIASGTSQFKFGVLARIVRHMKARHMEGEDHPLTLEDILDETKQLDVGNKTKAWLANEALRNNPKISASPDGTYMFKPPYSITNKKGLLKLLRQYDLKGQGGIYLEDVQESLPRCDRIVEALTRDAKIMVVTRPQDKKKVLFYHDHTSDLEVDDEFQKLWRSVAVDGLDERKIEEYLEKQGIRSMQEGAGARRQAQQLKRPGGARRRGARRKPAVPRDNEHLRDVLEDYDGMSAEKMGGGGGEKNK